MNRQNQKGFSLVELMVVVAIIGILSTIAIPQINKYMARARQTEAKTNLASIYTANKAFYAEYNIYDSRFDVIGFRPEGKLRYNTGWADNTGQCTLGDFGYTAIPTIIATNAASLCGAGQVISNGCSLLPDGNQSLTGTSLACPSGGTPATFAAGAAGRVSSSGSVDRWKIDHQKMLTNTADGTN